MLDIRLKYCPSTLKEGFHSFSPLAIRKLFNGKKVRPILPFSIANSTENIEVIQRISISGVQEKHSLILDKNELRLVKFEEHGRYILKPIPNNRFKAVTEIPANEHLTMQIAQQVYQIETAENTIIFFADGEQAYLTKRFDYDANGEKLSVEDFAALAGKSSLRGGSALKYEGSYVDMANLIKQNVATYPIELEKFFKLVLFNYLFSNGDAHLKNFSLIDTPNGDMVLAPAYDLLCTRLHVNDTDMAMADGLFSGDYETASFAANAFYAYDDFLDFGIKIGINEKRVKKMIAIFQKDHVLSHQLIAHSFLSNESKRFYTELYFSKLQRLNYQFEKG